MPDVDNELAQEMFEKELLLLGRLKAHRDLWEKVHALTSVHARTSRRTHTSHLHLLLEVHNLAEQALTL